MSLRFIEVPSPESDGELPWLKDYLSTLGENPSVCYEVRLLNYGQKGVLITTEYFKCFLFKSHPYYAYTLEAVQVWASEKKPVCPLVVVPDSKDRTGFKLAIEDEAETIWVKTGEATYKTNVGSPSISSPMKGSNPLLAKTPSDLRTNPRTQGGEKKKERSKRADAVSEAATSLSKAFLNSEVLDSLDS